MKVEIVEVKEDEKESGKTYYEIGSSGYFYEGNFSPVMPELNMDNEDVKEEIVEEKPQKKGFFDKFF